MKVFKESIDYLLLTESQAKTMKINDRDIVQVCFKSPNSSILLNDGTNACVFLAIGVIDIFQVYQHSIQIYLLMK